MPHNLTQNRDNPSSDKNINWNGEMKIMQVIWNREELLVDSLHPPLTKPRIGSPEVLTRMEPTLANQIQTNTVFAQGEDITKDMENEHGTQMEVYTILD